MTRRMYRAVQELKYESRRPHRTRSDFEREKEVKIAFKKFKENYYSGRRGYDKIYGGR